VRPTVRRQAFAPNRILEVTPGFLDAVIQHVRQFGYEIVTLDEAQRRLVEGEHKQKFVCFTLDDGYADNYFHAFPVFKKQQAPFTVYVSTSLPDGSAVLWWQLLEELIRMRDDIELDSNDSGLHFETRTSRQKYRAFNNIYWSLRRMPPARQRDTVCALFDRYDVDYLAYGQSCSLSWDMIKELATSGWATIGAHTINHFALSKLTSDQVREEADRSRQRIATQIGHVPKHFSYPYGDSLSAGPREFDIIQELGFETATTTRKGVLFPDCAEHLHALPRVSLNGDYQELRYVTLFLSGAPFALWQRFRRLDVH